MVDQLIKIMVSTSNMLRVLRSKATFGTLTAVTLSSPPARKDGQSSTLSLVRVVVNLSKSRSSFSCATGWNNVASVGTILSYVFYWLAAIVVLVYMKWSEGRTSLLGIESRRGRERRIKRQNTHEGNESPISKSEQVVNVENPGHGELVDDEVIAH
jgi:hypothetical protein